MLKTPLEYVASVIFAAGKGSRMVGYNGNKTLLPLIPAGSIYEGERPLLLEVLSNLPSGPKGIVVNHCAEDVQRASEGLHASFLYQPVTNGTGGALLAARPFLESTSANTVVITMGDVPLIRPATYERLVKQLDACDLAVLAFEPEDKAQYGVLEVEGERVRRVVEWKYWRSYSSDRQAALRFCNAGVYAARRQPLLHYMGVLAENPHTVQKKWGDRLVAIEEYFITDLVEMMSEDKRSVGMVIAMEEEVAGVDTPEALKQAQSRYASMAGA